jgi:hypothetical protein
MKYLSSTKVELPLYKSIYHDKAYSACAGKDVHNLGFSIRLYRLWVGPTHILVAKRNKY